MANLVASGAKGVSNSRGFYRYTKKEARRWEKRFLEFSYEIRALATRYAEAAQDD
jgi:3-hydroxybutyryl-CoA dehydrogenase